MATVLRSVIHAHKSVGCQTLANSLLHTQLAVDANTPNNFPDLKHYIMSSNPACTTVFLNFSAL